MNTGHRWTNFPGSQRELGGELAPPLPSWVGHTLGICCGLWVSLGEDGFEACDRASQGLRWACFLSTPFRQGPRWGGPTLPGEGKHERVIHPLGRVRTWTHPDLRRRSSELGIRRLPMSWPLITARPQPPQSDLFLPPVKWA